MSTRLRQSVRLCNDIVRLRAIQSDQADAALGRARSQAQEAERRLETGARHGEEMEAAWRRQIAASTIDLQMAAVMSRAILVAAEELSRLHAARAGARIAEKAAVEEHRAALNRRFAAEALLKRGCRKLNAAEEEQRQQEMEDRAARRETAS